MDEIAAEGNLRIRRMRDDDADYELMVRWRNAPHVREWWDPDEPPLDLDEARRKYGPRTQGEDPATACVIELDGRAIGYIQFYPWDEEPEAIEAIGLPKVQGSLGLDMFLGEPDLVGQGFGSDAVDLVCRYLFRERDASSVMLTTATDNARAIRAYERAGSSGRGGCLTPTRGRGGGSRAS